MERCARDVAAAPAALGRPVRRHRRGLQRIRRGCAHSLPLAASLLRCPVAYERVVAHALIAANAVAACAWRRAADGAWILWSGSLVLARCVEAQALATVAGACGGRSPVAPWVAVELGAGSGLVSVVAGAAGLAAIATEQESGLPYLKANAAANTALFANDAIPGSCTVRKLHWGTAEDLAAVATLSTKLARPAALPKAVAVPTRSGAAAAPALLLGSDLTYLPAVMEPLAATLAELAGPQTVVWIAHDDASHPGCPTHRDTFFGVPTGATISRRPSEARRSNAEPEPEVDAGTDQEQSFPDGWVGTHNGGILERYGFDVARLVVEDLIGEEWRVPTVHVFELRLKPPPPPADAEKAA